MSSRGKTLSTLLVGDRKNHIFFAKNSSNGGGMCLVQQMAAGEISQAEHMVLPTRDAIGFYYLVYVHKKNFGDLQLSTYYMKLKKKCTVGVALIKNF